jgi:hypothetical protein
MNKLLIFIWIIALICIGAVIKKIAPKIDKIDAVVGIFVLASIWGTIKLFNIARGTTNG